MICTPSLASCITGRIFSLIADTCIHKGLKLSTSSNKLMSVMLVPGWAWVISEARSSMSDAWSSIPWTMITGLKQNVFVRDKNKSAIHSSRKTKFAIFSTVRARRWTVYKNAHRSSKCKKPADWLQKWLWRNKPIKNHGLLRGGLFLQRVIWRQLQGKEHGGHHSWAVNCATFFCSVGSYVNFWSMDEKIIRLCEESNVPSLVQALSTLKNQKVCVFSSLRLHVANSDQFCLILVEGMSVYAACYTC